MRLRKLLRRNQTFEVHLCRAAMPKMSLRYLIVCVRNILFFTVVLSIIIIFRESKSHEAKFVEIIPKRNFDFLTFKEKKYPPLNISNINSLIRDYNTKQTILNQDIYGPVKRDTVIIVIFVKKLTLYLRYLLVSLAGVRGVEDAIVIFSHLYYDENLNQLIRTIDYCRVLQIFYPYSLQVYPNKFPGFGENDCPYNMNPKDAMAKKCEGAVNPDLHGQYRNPQKAEQKHRWWWTANKVFEDLPFSQDHEGITVFLDDDVFFTEDFLYMLLFMREAAASLQQCDFLSLGTPMPSFYELYENNTFKVEVSSWNPQFHASVLAFGLTTWNKIVARYDLFCYVDEYSWSVSLFDLSLNMNNEDDKFKVMSSVVPRAYKIQSNGFFEGLESRAVFENVYRIIDIQRQNVDDWFPPFLKMYTTIELQSPEFDDEFKIELGGGWSDPRDRRLCSNMTLKKIKKVLFDMANDVRE